MGQFFGVPGPSQDDFNTLKNEFFGKIEATTNFNNIVNDGIYLLDWVSSGTTYNRPVNAGGRLEHSTSTKGSGTTKQQTYTTYAGEVYVRGYSNSTWTSWQQLATNVLTLTNVSFATALSQMKEDSICLLRSWSTKDDYPVAGDGNHQGVIFFGEGSRMIMVYANGDKLYIKTGATSNPWHQIY